MTTGAGLRPIAKAVVSPPDPTVGAPALDPTGGRTAETHSLRDEQDAAVRPYAYIPTGSGFLYLRVVVDTWSRRVVGWAMASHLRTQLVLNALDMALGQRRLRSVIHHSDHGSQYTALAFGMRCPQAGVRPSIGR